MKDASEVLARLNPVQYDMQDGSLVDQYGFIAQEVLEVLPEVVYMRESDGMLSVDHSAIIPVIAESLRESAQLTLDLQSMLREMESRLAKNHVL